MVSGRKQELPALLRESPRTGRVSLPPHSVGKISHRTSTNSGAREINSASLSGGWRSGRTPSPYLVYQRGVELCMSDFCWKGLVLWSFLGA